MLAWHIEVLQRQKTLPPLLVLLGERGQRQSVVQQRAMLATLSEQYGIPIKPGKAKTR